MEVLDSICMMFRGRINILDLYNQPLLVINNLYRMAFDRNKAEAKLSDEEKAGRALAEVPYLLEEGMV